MTDLSPDEVIDLLIVDRMTETFSILQAAGNDADRARLLAALGSVRNALAHGRLAPGDELAVAVEGATEEAVIRACLADLERTSLGAPAVRVVRAQASARRVADVLLRYQQAAAPGARSGGPASRTDAGLGSESLLTAAEVTTIFGITSKTLVQLAKAGNLTSVRATGGHRRYREAEVRALLENTRDLQREDGLPVESSRPGAKD